MIFFIELVNFLQVFYRFFTGLKMQFFSIWHIYFFTGLQLFLKKSPSCTRIYAINRTRKGVFLSDKPVNL